MPVAHADRDAPSAALSRRGARGPLLLLALLLALVAPSLAPVDLGLTARAEAAPALTLDPYYGRGGSTTDATVSGFPRTRVTLTVAGRAVAGARTDASGTAVFADVLVPQQPDGTTVEFLASGGGVSASAVFTVGTEDPGAPPPPGQCAAPAEAQVPQQAHRPAFGVSNPSGFYGPDMDAVTKLVAEQPSLALAFADFTRSPDVAGLDAMAARGITPVITWEPWEAGATDQSAYALSTFVPGGPHEAYIEEWAGTLKCHGRPVVLRFAHEMNGDWYPWSVGVAGNTGAEYVAAWRYVHGLFEEAGAVNVLWAWAPNVPFTDGSRSSSAMSLSYPGDDVVDVLGLDGYNWGSPTWEDPQQVLAAGLTELRGLGAMTGTAATPILVTETASAERTGDRSAKPTWIREFMPYLEAQPDVLGFVWFNHRKENDWRIDSSRSSSTAFREALAARR